MLRTELSKFFLFTTVLLFFSVYLAGLRVEHRELIYADSGVSQTDLQSLAQKENLISRLKNFLFGLATGNTGKTLAGENISTHLMDRFGPTLHLALFSVFIGSSFAIFVSLAGLYLQQKWFSDVWIFISNLILATPVFVAAVLLLLIFFSWLNLLPPGGYENGNTLFVILPGVALGMRVFGRMVFFSNEEILTEYSSPYIMILRTRGYSEKRIIFHHIFRKVFPILIVYILLDFSSLMSGAMIVEEIFFFPGIGKSMYSAIRNMDVNLLQSLLFYTGMIFYVFNRIAVYWQEWLKGSH